MNTIPIYSFVAFSGTGKTTMLEQLVRELKRRGLRVAVVKHDAHDFEIDKEGKDSWRMSRAGADTVAIVSSEKAAIMENRQIGFEELLDRLENVDIILTEGYKTGKYPKIALCREASGNGFAVPPEECVAVMSDKRENLGAPWFALEDIEGITDFLLIHGGIAATEEDK